MWLRYGGGDRAESGSGGHRAIALLQLESEKHIFMSAMSSITFFPSLFFKHKKV